MTKNRSMKIAVLVLALALLTSCFVGSTFAKYTSSAEGSVASTTVAKWAISAGVDGAETSITGTPNTFAFNLFTTIQDTKNNATDPDEDYTESDVRATMIAPGTKGSFTLSVVNNSDVNAEYSITFDVSLPDAITVNEESKPLPIQFRVNGGAWGSDIADVAATAIAMDGTADVVVEWQWVFTGDSDVDTAWGVKAAEGTVAVSVTPTLTVEQVD